MKNKCKFCKRIFNHSRTPQKYCSKPCYYKSKFVKKKPCSVRNCVYKAPAQSKGLCVTHYVIWRNHGDPNFKIRRRRGTGSFTEGYKIVIVNGKRIREHRHIIQKYLKRTLKPNEIVHHKNGKRSDNRLCNLEVQDRGKHTSHHNQERWDIGASSFGR